MDRREFLVRIGGALVAVPFVLEAVSCGKDESPTQPGAGGFTVTSSVSNGHTHTVFVVCANLSSSTAVRYTSGSGSGHTHQVELSVPNLQTIQGGGQVDVHMLPDATPDDHVWTIRKSAPC